MRAHRTYLLAARAAHAKRARSRCAAASTGQAPTPCTRTRQLQRRHSFPCTIHAPWLHVPPEACMGSMKRDLAFWTCHTRTPRSSGRVTAAVGGPQDAPSGPTDRSHGMHGQQGGHRSAEVAVLTFRAWHVCARCHRNKKNLHAIFCSGSELVSLSGHLRLLVACRPRARVRRACAVSIARRGAQI